MSLQMSPEELLKPERVVNREEESKRAPSVSGSMADQREDLGLAPTDSRGERDELGERYLEARRQQRPATLNDAGFGSFKENCGLLSVGAVTNQTGGEIATAHGFGNPAFQPATAWYGADDTEHDAMGGVRPSVLSERFEAAHGNQMKWIADQMVSGQTLGLAEFERLKREYNLMRAAFMMNQPSTNGVIQGLMAEYIKDTLGRDNVSVETATEPGETLPVEEALEEMNGYPTGTQFVVFLRTADGGCAHYVYAERAKDVLTFVDFQPKRKTDDTAQYASPAEHPTSQGAPTKVPFPQVGRADTFSEMNFLAVIPTAEYMKTVVSG